MATQSRTLKLSILAETKQLADALKGSQKNVQSFGDQLTDFGKKAALAFAAAGAAIGAFAVKSVQNAAADEGAQRKLTETLQKTTNATSAQIAAVGQYIDKTSIAIGVTDDELRPAFSRLARSTNDVQAAQDLLNLALDVSSATGKPLEAVANALGKAYDGNAASLGRLGLGIDASTLKSGKFDDIFKQLTGTFGGFAANEANTVEKSFVRIKLAIDEAQERIGAALLPLTERLTAFILENAVPALNAFVGGLTGDQGVSDAFTDSEKKAFAWGERVKSVIGTVINLKDELIVLGGILATIFVVSKISAAVTATIALITGLIKAYNALKASAIVAGVATYFALNPLAGVAAAAIAAGVLAAAQNLVGRSDIDVGDFNIAGVTGSGGFSGVPFSGVAGLGGAGGGGGGAGGGGGGAGGGGGVTAPQPKIIGSIDKLNSELDVLIKEFEELDFALETGQLTNKQGTKRFNVLLDKFEPLGKLANQIIATQSPTNQGIFTTPSSFTSMTGRDAPNITVNMGVVGDPEGVKRALINLQNEGFYRGTGGANLLVGLP
jgi:hypothetical protein